MNNLRTVQMGREMSVTSFPCFSLVPKPTTKNWRLKNHTLCHPQRRSRQSAYFLFREKKKKKVFFSAANETPKWQGRLVNMPDKTALRKPEIKLESPKTDWYLNIFSVTENVSVTVNRMRKIVIRKSGNGPCVKVFLEMTPYTSITWF